MTEPLTMGIHHLGLAVLDLDASERFFVDILGWRVVGGVPTYPAVFVSDGTVTLTLWRVTDPDRAVRLDRRTNVGLHHLALKVADRDSLLHLFERVKTSAGTVIEFPPTPMREGSALHHFICAMPGGIRIEFASAK